MEIIHLFKKGAQKFRNGHKMLKNDINISYEVIMETYNFSHPYIEETISLLFSKQKKPSQNISIKSFKTQDIISIPTEENQKPDNNLKPLDEFKDKTGVYIFLDKDKNPSYIGVAGEKNAKQHLRKRLEQHFNCNSGLSKNIIEIENLLNNIKIKPTNNRRILKDLILEYVPNFLVIEVGTLEDETAVKRSLNLEKCLIAIFNSKYNK